MAEAPARLRAQQYGFAAHLRDPGAAPPPPGIEERRLAVYRELFYNNVEGLLAANFPVMRRLLDEADWHALVRAFYREHRAHTPLFPEVGREFLRYLEARAENALPDPAWLPQLAHYEWVELALSLDETELDDIACDPDGDLLDGVPVPSPLAWPLAYAWPVQRLAPGAVPATTPSMPTFLLVLRDRSDAIRFKELTPVTFKLLQALHGNDEGLSGRTLLAGMAGTASQPVQPFVAAGAEALQQLRACDAILGSR